MISNIIESTSPEKTFVDETEPKELQKKSKWFSFKIFLSISFFLLITICLDLIFLNISIKPKVIDVILSESGPNAFISVEADLSRAALFTTFGVSYVTITVFILFIILCCFLFVYL